MNGIVMTMLEGGAVSDRRESRLTKEARSVAGRCLGDKGRNKEFRFCNIFSVDVLTSSSEKAP